MVRGGSVLVVSCSPGVRDRLCGAAVSEGYMCSGVETGRGAIEELRKGEHDVVLFDLHLSDMDCLTFLGAVQEVGRVAVPIAYGEHLSTFDVVRTVRAGAFDVVDGEGEPGDLARALSSVMEQTLSSGGTGGVESSARYWQTAFNSLPDPVTILDREHRVVQANLSASLLAGLPLDAMVGKKCHDLFESSPSSPMDCPHALCMKDGLYHTREYFDMETQEYWFISASPLFDPLGRLSGSVHVMRDITDLKKAEESLRKNEEKFRAIYVGSHDAIQTLTEDGYLDCNPKTLEVFGFSSVEEFVLTHPADLSPPFQPDGRASLDAALARIGEAFERGSAHFEWVHQRRNGEDFPAEVMLSAIEYGGRRILQATVRDQTERIRAMEEIKRAHAETECLLASMSSFLIGVDAHQVITRWNAAARTVFGRAAEDVIGVRIEDAGLPVDWRIVARDVPSWPVVPETVHLPDLEYDRADGKRGVLGMTISPVKSAAGESLGLLLSGSDISERKNLEFQLNQAQKLESIGQLAAGIAHEINTPTQFVGDNLEFLRDGFSGLLNLISMYTDLVQAVKMGVASEDMVTDIENAAEEAGLDYLVRQIPLAVEQSLEGVFRVASIVKAMKEFSHPDVGTKTPMDVNRAIESTVTVAKNEWKYVAKVELELDPQIPFVSCLPGEFNQVILNILINAAHAVSDARPKGSSELGAIAVSTRRDEGWVEIRIRDTGTGIPPAIRNRVFDPFFTTKEVGRGTGQGLAIAHSVIVDRLGGTIAFETEMGVGTVFILRLPIQEES